MILLIDGYNMIHRARFGFMKGENSIIFNFFRILKSSIDAFQSEKDCGDEISKVYFVLEGYPHFRKELYPEYKMNRVIDQSNTKKVEEMQVFREQKDKIIDILKYFPIEVVKHPDYECDDVIASLTESYNGKEKVTIISSDSDFTQLLSMENSWVDLWNPIAKSFVTPTEYDYVSWKSLVGDTADNIVGLNRVGDKTAKKILLGDTLEQFLEDPEKKVIYDRNYKLIKFARPQLCNFEVLSGKESFSEEKARGIFAELKFKSIASDNAWPNYWDTFKKL